MFTGRATLGPEQDGAATAGLFYTAPTRGSSPAERCFALSIAGARKSLYITKAYFARPRFHRPADRGPAGAAIAIALARDRHGLRPVTAGAIHAAGESHPTLESLAAPVQSVPA